MMNECAIDLGSRTVVVGDWRRKAEWARAVGDGRAASVRLRNDLHAVIVLADNAKLSVAVELWVGEPGKSDGAALNGNGSTPTSWTQIALCECGERGCSNGVQFSFNLLVEAAARLLAVIESLPRRGFLGDSPYTWKPDESGTPYNEGEMNREILDALDLQ